MQTGAGEKEDEDQEENWFRHPWEDEPADEPPETGPAPRAGGFQEPATVLDAEALLLPLAGASAALARLDARLETADPAVGEGLRARIALREAAGWLAHQHATWVHPIDLGLREAGLTGSLIAAAMAGRLRDALPATTHAGAAAADAMASAVAEDRAIAQALQLGRLWRRLAEHRSWAPLAETASLRQLLAQLGDHAQTEDGLADWLGRFASRRAAASSAAAGGALPALVLAAQAAQAWPEWQHPEEGRGDRLATAAVFLAACIWRWSDATPAIALPIWSATPRQLDSLALTTGPLWVADFLGVITDATQCAGQELTRLQTAAERAATLRRTARSQLPAAAVLALRLPVLTARGLADQLRISPQAALGLLKELVAAGVLREATGRASWRAFVVA